MHPVAKTLLSLVTAAAPLTLGGCSEIRDIVGLSRDRDDRYLTQSNAYYTQPAYGQPGYQAPVVQAPIPQPVQPAYGQPNYGQPYGNQSVYDFQQNQPNQFASTQFPTTGHWEWGTAPDGRRTRIWIPDNSYKLPAEAYGVGVPQPWAPPRFNQPYAHARGRYDTIRMPDGRLEHEWRADEPSSPAQGYWQVVNNGGGLQRTWIPSVVNTASDR